ncbi:cytochrome d ubiquinol oxidase subunit II [Sciscionella sediminilitoris]|uniref:cytochrome d ubiquinol oxidase subunit II n=1 Tax=Sciscionella sediminilitoris TaxID=1445613 RepID=UPI0004DEEFD2|nr:cytochrome d ubiquinol oxidase subunit II [Sciscionella sp. SE31]
MGLHIFWFCLIALTWTGYLFLEGFDFGVGMLVRGLARGDTERRVLVNTIGPVWDGNEVWLIVSAGAMFAAFPAWYADLFAAFYVPLILVLLALIGRGVAFDYRGKVENPRWRAAWDAVITVGSVIPPLGIGAMLGTNVGGIPLDAQGNRVGSALDVFSLHSLLGALGVLGFSLAHGLAYTALKTEGELRDRARRLLRRYGIVLLLPLLALLALQLGTIVAGIGFVLAVLGALTAWWRAGAGRDGQAFAALGVVIAAAGVTLFGSLFPNVLVSTVEGVPPLSVAKAASSPYTLEVMTWIAAFATPAVLIYQAWSYWVFRKRIGVRHIPAAHAPKAAA